jgi:hypothetical protein
VITHTEEAVENREVTFGAFLDIEGAYDSTSFDNITKAAKQHGLGDTICRWIGSMLGSSKITATLAGETLEGSVARGCTHSITSVVEPDCGQTHRRTQWEWLLYTGICR